MDIIREQAKKIAKEIVNASIDKCGTDKVVAAVEDYLRKREESKQGPVYVTRGDEVVDTNDGKREVVGSSPCGRFIYLRYIGNRIHEDLRTTDGRKVAGYRDPWPAEIHVDQMLTRDELKDNVTYFCWYQGLRNFGAPFAGFIHKRNDECDSALYLEVPKVIGDRNV